VIPSLKPQSENIYSIFDEEKEAVEFCISRGRKKEIPVLATIAEYKVIDMGEIVGETRWHEWLGINDNQMRFVIQKDSDAEHYYLCFYYYSFYRGRVNVADMQMDSLEEAVKKAMNDSRKPED
jgi:hypothetical protein